VYFCFPNLKMNKMKKLSVTLLFATIFQTSIFACTNFLVTKGASADGSTMITYAADSHTLYGELYFTPAANYPANSKFKVYEWDTGKYLGEIDQVPHTYSVIGNMNEFQLAIGETTYGGRDELVDTTGIIDYGSIIYITLQRAKTAREAIKVMSELVAKYGYYSSGESMSISDPNEVWIFEIIGKGTGGKGAVWVARMIPDGYVSAHANQARITTFPFQKKNNWFDFQQTTFNSIDVISFAKDKKYYVGSDQEFSFSDVYAPVDFGGARFCEIRVWAFFNSINKKEMENYWNYAKGDVKFPLEHIKDQPLIPANFAANRMPLWIKPDAKINVHQMMDFMRDHLENTELDMSKDFGAGPFHNPYRWRPLTWKVDGKEYCNERATATQQTGFSFVTQSRSWLPNEIGGIFWFSVDDAASTVYFPMYTSATQIPSAYAVGNGDMMNFTQNAAFWVFNMVSNFAYTRYDLISVDIRRKQLELENRYINEIPFVDKQALELFKANKKSDAIKVLTDFSVKKGNDTHRDWQMLYGQLFAKYMDGNIKEKSAPKENYKFVTPKLSQPGYGDEFYKNVVKETGEKFLMKGNAH
jgi:dipeptidase